MMKKSKGVVYCVTNTRNGKKYVGISTRGERERWAQHVSYALRGSKFPLHRAIRKHGPDAFTVRVLARSDDWEQLCRLEQHYIARLKTHVRHGGYNATAGGEGTVDPTEEVRAIHRERVKCQNADPEFRAKHLKAMKRLHTDPEFRAKNIEIWKRLNADPEFAARRDAAASKTGRIVMKRLWQDDAYRAKMIGVSRRAGQTTIQRLLAEGWRGERTAFTEFCRAHGLKPKHVRKRLRKRGIYGLKDINDPRVRAVLDEIIAQRRTDTAASVPARRAQSPETLRPTLH